MKVVPAVVGVLGLVAVVAWLGLRSESTPADPAYTRDRLVEAEALVATFSTGLTEGYRFVQLRNEGWTWERVRLDGTVLPDALVNDGRRTFLHVGEACWIPLRGVLRPYIPGLTATAELKRAPGVERLGESLYAYTLARDDAGGAFPEDAGDQFRITEDLGAVASGRFEARSEGAGPGFWFGDYVVRRATAGETANARALISSAVPSPAAYLLFQERILGSATGSIVQGPFEMVVAEGCPATPVILRPAALGGQVVGPRHSEANVVFGPGEPPIIRRGVVVPFAIYEAREDLLGYAEAGAYGDVPLTDNAVVVVEWKGSAMAFRMLRCDPQPFFRC